MPERTEALKKAQQKYMEKFSVARVRMERNRYEQVQAHADICGESVNAFINRAIDNQITQDGVSGPQEAVGAVQGAGVVSLPSETVKTAQEAAQASGETPSQFISRAVDAQFLADTRARLNEDRQDQTTADLVFEIEDTARLVTSMLWCNVSYNDKLYKKPKDAQKVRDALVECRQRIGAMLDNLIEKIGAHGDAHK